MRKNLYMLPDGLPQPVDDGACDHLWGQSLPSLSLPATSGEAVDLGRLKGPAVIFCYPMTGKPEQPPMIGWNNIPGARGCTPQCCAFRDRFQDFAALGVSVYGVSSQPLAQQQEAVERLRLPYALLNDADQALTRALSLPTFEYDGATYIKRLTLWVDGGEIRKVWYPVFPPHLNATDILAELD